MPNEEKKDKNSKQDYFPPKPKKEEEFLKPVSWLGGREFIASLKGIVIYAVYGQSKDPRSWMKSNIYPAIETKTPEEKLAESVTAETQTSEKPLELEAQKAEEHADKVVEFWGHKLKINWDWKQDNFEFWEKYLKGNPLPTPDGQGHLNPEEFWFDYIADTGDGQKAVYGVGCLCLSDLWLKEDGDVTFSPEDYQNNTLLPRGSFLFIGGDTGYYTADYSTLYERFQLPFRWAFASVRKYLTKYYGPKEIVKQALKDFNINLEAPDVEETEEWKEWDGTFPLKDELWDTEPLKPLIGVPANHDYYDDLDGFNRQFRRPPFENLRESLVYDGYKAGIPLKIPTFQREQEASYIALRLPFEWWLLGIDSENEKLDFRQRIFFDEMMKKFKPKKLILTTPEPTTVFGERCKDDDKTAGYLRDITKPVGFEQPFWTNGELKPIKPENKDDEVQPPEKGEYCRLDLSGDVHHYARYWGPADPTNPEGDGYKSENYASVVSGGGGAFLHPTETLNGRGDEKIVPQIAFPEHEESRTAGAKRIFDLQNLREGGYVQIIGVIIAVVIFVSLVYFDNTVDFFYMVRNPSITPAGISRFLSYLGILLPIILLFVCGNLLHRHIQNLKDVQAKKSTKNLRGRISELRLPVFLFFAGLLAYLLWFFFGNLIIGSIMGIANIGFQSDIDFYGYPKSLLLMGHFVISGLIFWISIEYGNWVMLKYKYFGDEKEGVDDWFHLFGEGIRFNFLESGENPISKLWIAYRTFSVKTLPTFILNIIAIVILIAGIADFGNSNLGDIAMNIIFTIVLFGGFFGIIYFAISTGADHQNNAGKFGFFFIGLWHALLQLFTPFIIVFYADWRLVLGIFILTILTNGKTLEVLTGGKLSNLGTWAMKKDNRLLLSVLWFLLGIVVLATPFLFPKQQSIGSFISNLILRSDSGSWLSIFPGFFSVLVVAYLGYRLSRVWFSWYLAVSLAFNGHNNVAGGAARIEDYKHILRIKLEREKMTVYVVGFDKAETELEKLKPKLVDKFELKCKSFP